MISVPEKFVNKCIAFILWKILLDGVALPVRSPLVNPHKTAKTLILERISAKSPCSLPLVADIALKLDQPSPSLQKMI